MRNPYTMRTQPVCTICVKVFGNNPSPHKRHPHCSTFTSRYSCDLEMENYMSENNDKTLLENLVMDAGGLEKLEAMIAGFNLFEAIGMKSQEIKHSATLAFLLNPSKPHGFGDYFLRRILKDITRHADTETGPIDIDCADVSDAEVWCERNQIDILIACKSAKLVISIENKIYARESSEQLKKYDKYVNSNKEWDDYAKLFVFLTIDGDIAVGGSKNVNWIPHTHENVTKVLEASLQANRTNIGVDQEVLIRHYLELMRRHILPDSDTAKLARDIYRKHKQALDLIIEHRPDLRGSVSDMMSEKIKGNNPPFNDLKCAPISTNYFRYTHKDWTFSEGWQGENAAFKGNGFSFEINLGHLIRNNALKVELVMGDIPNLDNRKTLHETIYYALKDGGINGIKNAYLKDQGEEPSSISHRRIWVVTEELKIDDIDDTQEFMKATQDAWLRIMKRDQNNICDIITKALNGLNEVQER